MSKRNIWALLITWFILLMGVTFLTGCEDPTIKFEGEERPMTEVEDIISDRLESENPGMDLDMDIYEEVE